MEITAITEVSDGKKRIQERIVCLNTEKGIVHLKSVKSDFALEGFGFYMNGCIWFLYPCIIYPAVLRRKNMEIKHIWFHLFKKICTLASRNSLFNVKKVPKECRVSLNIKGTNVLSNFTCKHPQRLRHTSAWVRIGLDQQ